jgi:hypothetical protein
MSVHTIFTVITNLFGLNFYEQKVSLAFVLFLHLVGSFFTVFHILYASYINNTKLKGIYVFADFVQLGIPFLIKTYFMYRAIRMANFDLRFDGEIRKVYEKSQVKQNERKFLVYLSVGVAFTAVKNLLSKKFTSVMYNSCQILSATVDSASDFIAVFHMRCLSDHMKFVAEKGRWKNKELIYKIIELKHLIHKRFDVNLFLTISSYFLLMIIALFWVFMRIAFGFLTTVYGKLKTKSFKVSIFVLRIFKIRYNVSLSH